MSRRPLTLIAITAALLLLVGLLNGGGFYLKRIGVLDAASYQAELRRFCGPPPLPLWLPARCHAARRIPNRPPRLERIPSARLYQSPGFLPLLKLAKTGLLLVVVAGSLRRWRERGARAARIPSLRQLRPALPLLLSTLLSLLISLDRVPAGLAAASLLSASWLLVLPFGGWLSRRRALSALALAVALLLLAQLPLLLLEASRGLPISFGPAAQHLAPQPFALPGRLAGSFVHPNSLGAAVTCGLGFCLAHLRRRAWLPLVFGIGLVLVLAARSGAGLLGWLVLLLWWRCPPAAAGGDGRLRPVLLAAPLVALLALLLPGLLGRPDLFRSLSGRGLLLLQALDAPPLELLFGKGLASYSNQLSNLLGPDAVLAVRASDGMPTLLLLQGGLLAVLAFYGLLLWAWRADPIGRPFLLAIGLTSLTLNVTELTPFNLLFGLSLSRALWCARPPHPSSTPPTAAAAAPMPEPPR